MTRPVPQNPRGQTNWWETYFSHHYGHLYRGVLAEELLTETELETIDRLFAECQGPFLDVGCGYGRHLVDLGAAGLPVFGIDRSPELIAQCPRPEQRRIARADMRRLPFPDETFGGAYLLFNSFGYFSDQENEGVLAEIGRVLRPGGLFIMDLPVRAGMRGVVREMPESGMARGGAALQESWRVDEETRRLEGEGTWTLETGESKEWRLSLRLYTPWETARMLARCGFAASPEIRPLGEMNLLGLGLGSPALTDRKWQRATNMAVLARRATG